MTRKQLRRARLIVRIVIWLLYSIALCAIVATCTSKRFENVSAGSGDTSSYIETSSDKTNESDNAPAIVERYSAIAMTTAERDELAAIIYLEARNQCPDGQQAVAEVVFNRVINVNFPNSVYEVLHEGEYSTVKQFTTITKIDQAKPTQAQYDAIDAALYGPTILPHDVVFFSRNGENDRVWGQIQDHIFCYEYLWE